MMVMMSNTMITLYNMMITMSNMMITLYNMMMMSETCAVCLALVGEDELLVERAHWCEHLVVMVMVVMVMVTVSFTIPHFASHPSQLPWFSLDSCKLKTLQEITEYSY